MDWFVFVIGTQLLTVIMVLILGIVMMIGIKQLNDLQLKYDALYRTIRRERNGTDGDSDDL